MEGGFPSPQPCFFLDEIGLNALYGEIYKQQ